MGRGKWIQRSLFEDQHASSPAAQQSVEVRRRRRSPSRLRPSYVRVTSDPDVASSWDQSHRLSSEVTWQLAQRLTEAQIDELRGRLGLSEPTAN